MFRTTAKHLINNLELLTVITSNSNDNMQNADGGKPETEEQLQHVNFISSNHPTKLSASPYNKQDPSTFAKCHYCATSTSSFRFKVLTSTAEQPSTVTQLMR